MNTLRFVTAGRLFFIAVLCSSAACGQLSNDDLVFLNGVPKSPEVTVGVADTSTNASALSASVGATATYFDDLAKQAAVNDAQVDHILEFIDNIGHGYAPTKRTADIRVWGPVPNVKGQHYTVLYEIRRDRNSGVFTYCLWLGQDSEVTGEPTCDDVPAFDATDQQPVDGMVAVLYGNYAPSVGSSGALDSTGQFTLALEAAYEHQLSPDRGTLGVNHAYGADGATKAIDVIADAPAIGTSPAVHAEVTYAHAIDGLVRFGLDTPANVITKTDALEQLSIRSCWSDGSGGRADVTITGGDLAGLREATSEECWDANKLRTYFIFTVPDYPTLTSTEGDVNSCPAPGCQ